jgi:hypothetical protein
MGELAPMSGSRTLTDLAGAIGVDATIRLALAFPGQKLHVPVNLSPDHKLVRRLGPEIAAKIHEHYFNTQILIPIGLKREAMVREMLARRPQPSVNEIVEATGVSYRQVLRYRSTPPFAGFGKAAAQVRMPPDLPLFPGE